MKISTKTSIILLSTLILGVIIGVLGSGLLHQKRIEKIQTMDSGRRFKEVIFDFIKPDKSQRQTIEGILKKQTVKISQLEEDYQGEVFSIFDSTKMEIKSLLSEKQLKQLEKGMNKGQDHYLSRRIRHLKELLKLSDEQYKELEELVRESEMAKHSFIFQGKINRTDRRKMREELIKKIEVLLTPEQIEKYRATFKRGKHQKNCDKTSDNEK